MSREKRAIIEGFAEQTSRKLIRAVKKVLARDNNNAIIEGFSKQKSTQVDKGSEGLLEVVVLRE